MSIVSERRPMESSAVWKAADVADSGDWSVTLDATQRAELVGAAREAVAKGYSLARYRSRPSISPRSTTPWPAGRGRSCAAGASS